MSEMKLDKNDSGVVVGPCENCGQYGHEHEKERVTHENGTYSYNYICPEDKA